MKTQTGFAPVIVLILAAIGISAAVAGYSFFHSNSKNIPTIKKASPTVVSLSPTATSTPTLKNSVVNKPTSKPFSTVSSTGLINAYFTIDDKPSNDEIFEFVFRNETTGEEKRSHNKNSSLSLSGLKPARYNISILFPQDRFMYLSRECTGCGNAGGFSEWGKCGYEVDLKAGDSITFICKFKPAQIIPINSSQSNSGSNLPDTTPPNTNIYYPAPNGSLTYKIDGKVCAIATAPNDNSGPDGIETEYRFDNGPWSGYATGRAYLCADVLPNGPHTLSYHSKDKAGNVETTKTISFTVNIPGN